MSAITQDSHVADNVSNITKGQTNVTDHVKSSNMSKNRIKLSNRHEWFTYCNVGENEKNVNFKLDTGSMVNILPRSLYPSLTRKQLNLCKKPLTAYNNQPIEVLGEQTLQVRPSNQDKSYMLNFVIVNQESVPILGLESCERMGLVRKMCVINQDENLFAQYKDVFDAPLIGLNAPPVHINVQENAEGEQVAPRRIPFSLLDKVKKELQRMEQEGVISKVNVSTKFVSPMVLVEKSSGELRICLDPQALNAAVISEKHAIPTV